MSYTLDMSINKFPFSYWSPLYFLGGLLSLSWCLIVCGLLHVYLELVWTSCSCAGLSPVFNVKDRGIGWKWFVVHSYILCRANIALAWYIVLYGLLLCDTLITWALIYLTISLLMWYRLEFSIFKLFSCVAMRVQLIGATPLVYFNKVTDGCVAASLSPWSPAPASRTCDLAAPFFFDPHDFFFCFWIWARDLLFVLSLCRIWYIVITDAPEKGPSCRARCGVAGLISSIAVFCWPHCHVLFGISYKTGTVSTTSSSP